MDCISIDLRTFEIALHFRYEVTTPPDGQWGVELENGSFTGMIGQISREVCMYFKLFDFSLFVDFALIIEPVLLTLCSNMPKIQGVYAKTGQSV